MQKVICAWCQRVLHDGTVPPTHSICPSCQRAVLAQAEMSYKTKKEVQR